MTLDPRHLPSVATLHAELVHEHDSILGESPLWDDREQVLYWVDIDRGQIHRFDPVTKTNSTFILGGKVTSIGRRASGGLIASLKKTSPPLILRRDPSDCSMRWRPIKRKTDLMTEKWIVRGGFGREP